MLPPLFQARRSVIRMNEQKIGYGAQRVLRSEQQKFVPTEIALIFGNFEGCILSGIGSRSVPVDRLAGRRKRDLIGIF